MFKKNKGLFILILGTIFLLLLHPYLWMTWAKKDFEMEKRGIVLLSFNKRLLNFIFVLSMTLISILVVEYAKPESILIRIIIDLALISAILWYRIKRIPNKIYVKNKN